MPAEGGMLESRHADADTIDVLRCLFFAPPLISPMPLSLIFFFFADIRYAVLMPAAITPPYYADDIFAFAMPPPPPLPS